MAVLPVLVRSRRRGTDKRPFAAQADAFLSDDIVQGSSAILFDNHEPETGHADTGPTWAKHPNSVSTLNIQNGEVYNNSGSGRSLYYANVPPGTTAYSVRMELVIRGNTSGNNAGPVARLDPALNTYYSAELVPNGTSKVQLSLGVQKVSGFTRLSLVDWWPTLLTAGQLVVLVLKVSNERKVLYAQGPGETALRFIASSTDNSVNGSGFAGVTLLRGRSTDGQHPTNIQAWSDGYQDVAGTQVLPSPDPVQAPAVLWTPNYSVATETVQGVWFREQEPFVRDPVAGTVTQKTDRITVITSGIPGTPPAGTAGAFQVISNPYSNPATGAKTQFDVTATADVAGTTANTTVTLSAVDVAKLIVHDPLINNRTHEKMYLTAMASSTTVTVIRATGGSVVQPIVTGDTFSIPGGDVSHSGSETSPYFARRVEAYDRYPTDGMGGSNGGLVATAWPDPIGSVRWYDWWMYFDPIFYPTANPTVNGSKAWGPIHTQWKGNRGGSPPLAIAHDGGVMYLGGTKMEGPGHSNGYSLGAAPKGVWKRYTVGVRWETSAVNGWATAYVNGVLTVPKLYTATMDVVSGATDPIYLKEGMYVSSTWDYYAGDLVNMPNGAIFKAWYTPVRVCTTKELALA